MNVKDIKHLGKELYEVVLYSTPWTFFKYYLIVLLTAFIYENAAAGPSALLTFLIWGCCHMQRAKKEADNKCLE